MMITQIVKSPNSTINPSKIQSSNTSKIHKAIIEKKKYLRVYVGRLRWYNKQFKQQQQSLLQNGGEFDGEIDWDGEWSSENN